MEMLKGFNTSFGFRIFENVDMGVTAVVIDENDEV